MLARTVIEVACWAHARRKFFEAQDTDARASEMLRLIGEIYAVEEQGRKLNAILRQQLRQQFTTPLLARIRGWLDARANDVLPKSPLGAHMLTKLKVYAGAEHPHQAQQPKELQL